MNNGLLLNNISPGSMSSLSSKKELDIAHTPTFESFLALTYNQEQEKLLKDLKIGDLICGEVELISSFGVTIRWLCSDEENYEKDFYPLDIQSEISLEHFSLVSSNVERKMLIRAAVAAIDAEKFAFQLAFSKQEKLQQPPLGIISEDDLPLYFRNGQSNHDYTFKDWLDRLAGFKNPSSIDTLCQKMHLSIVSDFSFIDSVNSMDYGPEKCAEHMRRVQTHSLAMKSVERGVEKLRQGDHLVAMQHFNKALQIEADNVEGLVARGALYANKETYDMALADFRGALKIDSGHKNARKYLLETLQAQFDAFDRAGNKVNKCVQSAREILQLDPDHRRAKRYMEKYDSRPNNGACSSQTEPLSGSSASSIRRSLSNATAGKSFDLDEKTANDPKFLTFFHQYNEKYGNRSRRNEKRRRSSGAHSIEVISDTIVDGKTELVEISSSSSSNSSSSPESHSDDMKERERKQDQKKAKVLKNNDAVVEIRKKYDDQAKSCRLEKTSKDDRNYETSKSRQELIQLQPEQGKNGSIKEESKCAGKVASPKKTEDPELAKKLRSMEDFISNLKKKN